MSTGLCLGANSCNVNLVTKWAVDMNGPACDSLRLNHPETNVMNVPADTFLALLKEWQQLCASCMLITSNCSPHPDLDMSTSDEEEEESNDDDDDDDGGEGHVDVICGGPPCQGISGFNQFRNFKNPLEDPKNEQMKTFMDLVDFLRPKFVLMENVVDLFKFSSGFHGRYALSRLVGMNYQARMGMLAAGAYGLPQFRMRVFLSSALQGKKLPQFPLPTHKVDSRGVIPKEFECNNVDYENRDINLKDALFLEDDISDLPKVENTEIREEMHYVDEPKTNFQRYIRLGRDGVLGQVLYDHCPLQLNEDDYQRICHVPKRKGANFRDLPVFMWLAIRAEPNNQAICHPVEDRVLIVRENARLQAFLITTSFVAPSNKYTQVGNAVAVLVAKALGYSLALSFKGLSKEATMFTLPEGYGAIQELPADQTSSAEFPN
ncbi:hypothetical protein DM860_017384 [Cuscuta australis]|uniref:DNA (cytosine-5-)-methyltransferase n=1 Tax=Cuscuta australis TaxID=267555 RepID=A0A328DR77_9ASTE|nr:hypothetical protein DM860_017384 [Cuscuta australis]